MDINYPFEPIFELTDALLEGPIPDASSYHGLQLRTKSVPSDAVLSQFSHIQFFSTWLDLGERLDVIKQFKELRSYVANRNQSGSIALCDLPKLTKVFSDWCRGIESVFDHPGIMDLRLYNSVPAKHLAKAISNG